MKIKGLTFLKPEILNSVTINEKRFVFFAFTLTFLLRSAYVIFVYINYGEANWNDDRYYLTLGEQLASGNWNPHANNEIYMRVGPWMPLLIAAFIKTFGNPVIPFYLYNVLSASFMVIVLYYLGRDIFGKASGVFLAIWGMLNIEFFRYTPHLLKEPSIYLLVPLTLYLLIRHLKERNIKYIIWAAISFSVLIHLDERYIFYLPVFPCIILMGKSINIKKKCKATFFWMLTICLLMIPWGIRNYFVYNQVVLISHRTTVFTSKLWGDDFTNFKFDDFANQNAQIIKNNTSAANPKKQSNVVPLYMRTFINIWQPAFIKSKQVKYSWWDKPREQKWSLLHNVSSIFFYGIFLPFYLIGLIILLQNHSYLVLFVAILPIVHALLHSYLVMPEERYRYAFVFIIVLIGSWVLIEISKKIITRYVRIGYGSES